MGAWIEITVVKERETREDVAPHDGCVDWNEYAKPSSNKSVQSHPTMGAWIEIILEEINNVQENSRTPRWVRGLKFKYKINLRIERKVAPHDGCVDWNPFCFNRRWRNI